MDREVTGLVACDNCVSDLRRREQGPESLSVLVISGNIGLCVCWLHVVVQLSLQL